MVAEKKEQTKQDEGEVVPKAEGKKEPPTPKKPAPKKGPATRRSVAATKKTTPSPKQAAPAKEVQKSPEKVAEEPTKNEDVKDQTTTDDAKSEEKHDEEPATENGSEEVKVEESTVTTENDESDAKQPEDSSTLILSAEEEAEIAAQTNEDAVKTTVTKPISKSPPTKKENQKNVWVSNLSRGSKAAELKKLFSEKYTVESAKIVTNGKSFFGYICLETPEMAQTSAKELNGSMFAGKSITVSLSRPDVRKAGATDAKRREERRREARAATKKSDKKPEKDGEKTEDSEQKDDASKDGKESGVEKDKSKEKKKEESEEEKQFRRREQRYQRTIQDLRADVKRLTTEMQNNRRRLTETLRRLDMEKDKKSSMRRELESLEGQLKSERRRFTQEIEQMGKKAKLDEIRYQENRAILNKELDECRKLREFLERKSEDMGLTRSHRGSSPRRSGPSGRSMDRGSKDMHRSRGGRSPPPPPKIRRSRDRSPHSYKGSKKPRMDEPTHHGGSSSHYGGSQSYSGNSKPMPSFYNQGGGPPRGEPMFVTTSYPDQRFNSGGYQPSYPMGNPSLMSRPMGYPGSSGGPRKY
ncbi:scaffold attachment factor B1-like [Anthonomus grandis grandis]|uniref:scaffold attachment factor B1-like n=1 Tax=Anthonomus grandis grandis TaxID=2921223 RepID=UPI002165E327|nr:scaffold attachment factor B1-like [Anthonomus grandis grandis]